MFSLSLCSTRAARNVLPSAYSPRLRMATAQPRTCSALCHLQYRTLIQLSSTEVDHSMYECYLTLHHPSVSGGSRVMVLQGFLSFSSVTHLEIGCPIFGSSYRAGNPKVSTSYDFEHHLGLSSTLVAATATSKIFLSSKTSARIWVLQTRRKLHSTTLLAHSLSATGSLHSPVCVELVAAVVGYSAHE